MRDASSRAKRRVLIAGAADYGMLAMVLDACAAPGVALDVTVVDRCPTPLALCHWYARREKVRIVTVVADIAEFEVEDAFDLICTDSLLTLLKPEDRALTLARWRALLRPGGRVVTVARISAPGNAARIDRVQRIAGFSDLVRERATGMADRLDVDPAVLADEALSYGSSVTVSPIGSVAELEHGLASAGLELDVLDVGDLPGSVPADRAGPGAHQPATYARVVARAG
jgi:SAM-dependent methyltransferase